MKVQYTNEYTDEYGATFQPGWIAEHANGEGQRRIDAGVCIQVSDEARSFKLAPVQKPVLLCVPDEPTEQPKEEKRATRRNFKH